MKKLFTLLPAFLLFFSLTAAERQIVKAGKSDYVIVCNSAETEVPQWAARDLQSYIFKSTGAKLPIVKESQRNNRPAFLIGFDKVTAPEGFTVKTDGKDIRISGNDTKGEVLNIHWANGARTGTWYGVCDFLEKQLGIRWFMPGDFGEFVPKHADWIVGDLNYAEKPAMDMRRMGYVAGWPNKKQDRNAWLFLRRNRAGNAESWCAWHSWLRHFPKEYFDKHPEWFAMTGGRRYNIDGLGLGLHMCTTNSEALDVFAKNLIEFRKGWKVPIMLTLSPNDGGTPCQCDKCSALDDGVRPDGTPIITTRMMTYANEVAKRVNKVLPDQKFGMYAYAYYTEGVSKVKVDSHITIEEVKNDTGLSYYRASERADHLKNLKAWRSVLSKLYFYSTPEGMGNLELPSPQFENIRMLYENLYKADVTGIDMNNGTSFGATALNNYFYLKFAWKMPGDLQKFYEESMRDCYGEIAAPVMKGYFADVEKRLAKLANTKLDEDRGLGYIRRFPGVLTTVYPGLAEAWLPKMKEAAAKTADKGQKKRIEIAITNLEYCQATVELYRLAAKVAGTSNPDAETAAAADKAALKRIALYPKMAQEPSNTRTGKIARTEKNFRIPFDRNVFSFVMAQKARKTIKIEHRTAPPVLDGKLDDSFWNGLAVNRIELNKDDAKKFQYGADFKIAAVGNDLYIGIRCEEPLMEKMHDTAQGPKAAVWDENGIDMFFAPPRSKDTYYQLVFNSLGTIRVFRNGKNRAELPQNAVVKTARGKDFWCAEVKIPMSLFSAKKNFRGDIWGMNFCRTRRTLLPNEYSCWSPTFGDFHRPERFGKAIFR